MNKIDSLRLLILILLLDQPNFRITSGGLLIQATQWKHEIQDMFRHFGIQENDIEAYTDDYIDKLYIHKIKTKFIIYSFSF